MKNSKHWKERSTFLKKEGLDQIFVNTVMKNSDQALKRTEKKKTFILEILIHVNVMCASSRSGCRAQTLAVIAISKLFGTQFQIICV